MVRSLSALGANAARIAARVFALFTRTDMRGFATGADDTVPKVRLSEAMVARGRSWLSRSTGAGPEQCSALTAGLFAVRPALGFVGFNRIDDRFELGLFR